MTGPLQLTPGMVFARDYRIVRPLAEGGMGSVYVAEQLSTGKERAIKTMHADLLTNVKSRERFTQEARAASLIESDHVVEVVAAGVDDETGTPWLAMEMLKGEELSKVMKRRGRLPPDEVLEIFKQLCHALGAAHRVGICHRDLKPENIFLATPRRSDVAFTVKVLDFGIAKLVQEAKQGAQATGVIGSPLWMAPEQISAGLIRPNTDVWALGLIAFQLMTGKHYLRAANQATASLSELLMEMAITTIDPASARASQLGVSDAIPPGFDAWFARCVVREPEARFQDATQVIEALVPILSGRGVPIATANTMAASAPFNPATPSGPGGYSPQTPPPGSGGYTPAPMPPQGYSGYPPGAPMQQYPTAQAWSGGPMPMAPAPLQRTSGGRGVVVGVVVGAIVALAIVATVVVFVVRGNDDDSGATPAVVNTGNATLPFQSGQNWSGSYVCSGATTDLTIHITGVDGSGVVGVFDFRAPGGGGTGQYGLHGSYDTGSRHITFEPGRWIAPAEGMPGITPTAVNADVAPDGATFTGALPYPGCLPFVLRHQ